MVLPFKTCSISVMTITLFPLQNEIRLDNWLPNLFAHMLTMHNAVYIVLLQILLTQIHHGPHTQTTSSTHLIINSLHMEFMQ